MVSTFLTTLNSLENFYLQLVCQHPNSFMLRYLEKEVGQKVGGGCGKKERRKTDD